MKEKKTGLTKAQILELAALSKALESNFPGMRAIGSNADFGACEYCGAKDEELRPYGKGGAKICYECGQKDYKLTEANMKKHLFSREGGNQS